MKSLPQIDKKLGIYANYVCSPKVSRNIIDFLDNQNEGDRGCAQQPLGNLNSYPNLATPKIR